MVVECGEEDFEIEIASFQNDIRTETANEAFGGMQYILPNMSIVGRKMQVITK